MKPLRIVLALLLVSALMVGCIDTSTPKGVVEMLMEHIKKANYQEAEKIFTDPSVFQPIRQGLEEDTINSVLITKLIQQATITVDNETINGSNATVDATFDSIPGEGLSILRQHLEEVRRQMPENTSEEDIKTQLQTALDSFEWGGLKEETFTTTYHLSKVDGKWRIDSSQVTDPLPLGN